MHFLIPRGEVINGGFGLVLDGSNVSLLWYITLSESLRVVNK